MEQDEHEEELERYREYLSSAEVASLWKKLTPGEFAEFVDKQIREDTVAIREYAVLINRILYQGFLEAPSEGDKEQALRYCISTIIDSAKRIELTSDFARDHAKTYTGDEADG